MAWMINALTREQLQRMMFRPECDTTLEKSKTFFMEIFSLPKPKQFVDFQATHMQDNETPRAFHSHCEALVPCIKIGENQLAQWYFHNKMTDNHSRKEAMKMWVTNRPWKDIVAMIEKLWSSSRGKQRQETILEVDEERTRSSRTGRMRRSQGRTSMGYTKEQQKRSLLPQLLWLPLCRQ